MPPPPQADVLRSLAVRVTRLPRAWVAVLLVVAALDLAVVAAGTAGSTTAATTGLAPLVAGLGDATLVRDGVLVASDAVRATAAHALVVDAAAQAATATVPGDGDALVLAGDGLALLVGGDRWTVPYAGSLTAPDLHALLAGWHDAQRATAVLAALLTGALATTLSTAVLALGVRLGGRRAGRTAPRTRDVVARWSVALAAAATVAATAVLGTGVTGRGTALAVTFAAATCGVCLLTALDTGRPGTPCAPLAATP